MKKNRAVMLNATHSAAASRVDSRAFAFSSGVRYFSELFYYSFYREALAMRQKRRYAC
ncbi:MAG: hypothetical protein VB051_09170 [Candidatus Pelethousia sp.]|nr:hypothetical protein [Candidatus Pelethousia sp.]